MKHASSSIATAAILLATLASPATALEPSLAPAASHETASAQALPSAKPAPGEKTGKVIETMNAGRYTYILLDTGEGAVWAAGPQVFEVSVGDTVTIPEGLPMTNFHSKTLDRDFELVYFVDSMRLAGAPKFAPHGDTSKNGTASGTAAGDSGSGTKAAIDLSSIKVDKIAGGKTVGEIFEQKDELAEQEVTVRGQVTKFTADIMKHNWIHLSDGSSGPDGQRDLTVTTDGTAAVGDTVVVKGIVSVDQDFGFGYRYDVLIERATVTVE